MTKYSDLEWIQLGPDKDATCYIVGQRYSNGKLSRICLSDTGSGPLGPYDVIDIYFEDADRPMITIPAHQAAAWGRKP